MYIRYPVLPTITPNPSIFSVITDIGVDDLTFFYNIAQNQFQWDLDALDLARGPAGGLEANRWYLLEAKGDYSNDPWTAEVRIDSIPQDSVFSTNSPTGISSVQFGISAATQQWTGHFDDCAFAYGTSPLRFIGP